MRYELRILICMFAFLCGCGVQEPAQWKEWRERFVLKVQPEGPLTVAEAITRSADGELTVIAQIGGGKGDTFDNKIASFLVSEAPDKEHMGKPGHDADGCPFCKQRLANAPTVTVGFADPQGKAIPVDARKLFGVKKGDVVVIRGEGSYEESMKMLTLDAKGMYVISR